MREILFRGQTRKHGQKVTIGGEKLPGIWVYGGIFPGNGDRSIIYGGDSETLTISTLDKHVVYSETVGQFTGRTDKNGKKVFEHDILQTFTIRVDGTVEKCGVGIIQWWEKYQCYVLTTKEGYHIEDFGNLGRPEYYEVIGNIHDNPELLEVGEDGN